jgi:DNA polymerase type B, organellar and viral
MPDIHNRTLQPYESVSQHRHKMIVAIDVENNPDTGEFICAGVYGQYNKKHSIRKGQKTTSRDEVIPVNEYFTDIREFQDYILSLPKGVLLVFYNLSYDKVFLDEIIAPLKKDKNGVWIKSVLKVDSRVISCKLKNGIKCMDLFNHTMMGSLEDWIGYLHMTEKYGIKKTDFSDINKRVMNDVMATYQLGVFIQDFYLNECDVAMQLTVGATAIRLFRQRFFTDMWYRDNRNGEADFISNFERDSYYGGRTETFRHGTYYHYSYDINSTYVSVMRDELIPNPQSAVYVNSGYEWEYYFNKYLTVTRCEVFCPKTVNIPVLPVKTGGKLKFPAGFLTGTWTSVLLKRAIAAGYKIIKIHSFIYYKKAEKYFKAFAEFVWERRQHYKKLKNEGMDSMTKRLGNALYGKFAQRNGTGIEGKLSDLHGEVPEGATILEYKNDLYVITKNEKEPAEFEFPCVSSFITSYAQLKLYNAIAANEENIIYCDTDSVKLLKPATGIPVGKELGDWKFEYEKEATFIRPKLYDDKHKGVPKTCPYKNNSGVCECTDIEKCPNSIYFNKKEQCGKAYLVEKTATYMKFRYNKPMREREAMRRNMIANKWYQVEKILTFNDDKRVNHKDGTTEPIFFKKGELNELAAHKVLSHNHPL